MGDACIDSDHSTPIITLMQIDIGLATRGRRFTAEHRDVKLELKRGTGFSVKYYNVMQIIFSKAYI